MKNNVYMYKQITLLCSRNEHNIVNQLYINKINKKIKYNSPSHIG